MIQLVHEQAVKSGADEIIIATDTKEIAEAANRFGAEVMLTGGDCPSGTDRIREVAEKKGWAGNTNVINVQGDSPLISPISINQVADILETRPDADIATLAVKIKDNQEFYNTNVVKVVTDAEGKALYFSRAPIPAQDSNSVNALRHLGIYGYKVDALRIITSSAPVPLERMEQLEQLRALYMGLVIKVGIAQDPHLVDVDTPEDLAAVEKILGL